MTRYPCGSRDKTEACPNKTKHPRIISINSALTEAKQPVELHREMTDRILTLYPPLFDHSDENAIINLTKGGNWETSAVAAGRLGKPAKSHHQNPIKKTQGYRPLLCTHPMPSVWWWRGLSRLCSRASRVEMGTKWQPTCNHSW